jgi:hypothetical protein
MLFATLTSFAFSWDPPYGVPASFDCATRKLAYTFGRELVPRRGSFDALWYALDLAGNDTTCVVPNLALATAPAEEKKERTWSRNTLFVDSNNGVDRADRGTIEAPLRTIQSALDRVARNSQMSGTSYGTRRSQTPSPTIVLRGGIHYIAATLFIGPEHSGLEVVGHPNERDGGEIVFDGWQRAQRARRVAERLDVGTSLALAHDVAQRVDGVASTEHEVALSTAPQRQRAVLRDLLNAAGERWINRPRKLLVLAVAQRKLHHGAVELTELLERRAAAEREETLG